MSKHIPGIGCQCCAYSENECCCPDVDWRSAREVELEALVEKLTKERDELHRALNQSVPKSKWEKLQDQLAAIAEQNENLLPDLATPALNETKGNK